MTMYSLDDKQIKTVPFAPKFESIKAKLGSQRTAAVQSFLATLLDRMAPDGKTHLRKFNTSHLGNALSPWPVPLSYVYDIAHDFTDDNATEKEIQEEAGKIFGLFMWECIINQREDWVVWDPNLSARDPNREPMGKSYFERG